MAVVDCFEVDPTDVFLFTACAVSAVIGEPSVETSSRRIRESCSAQNGPLMKKWRNGLQATYLANQKMAPHSVTALEL